MDNIGKSILAALLAFTLMLPFNEWYEAATYALVFYSLLVFLKNLADGIPIKELIALIASLQWLLGPVLDYNYFNSHYRYYMYVEEDVYFSLTIPSFVFFLLGLSFFKVDVQHINNLIKKQVATYRNLPFILIGIGFLIEYIAPFVPASLRFVFFLFSNLKYIGAIYLLYSPYQHKWYFLAFILLFAFVNSVALGLFHDLLLWSVLVFFYIAVNLRFSFSARLLIICLGILSAGLIQVVKAEYRKIVWEEGFSGSETQVFTTVLENELNNEPDVEEYSNMHNLVIRLNQGWIISRIMFYVPFYEQFAEGETVEEALYASFVPRMLNPSKKKAGGQENFSRFTGYELLKGTSMGTSVLGEAYANYGRTGAVIFMFMWGLAISLIFKAIVKIASGSVPTLLLWIPLIFLQVIKAETELVVVLNHLVKASIFVFGIYWISYKIFKVQL